MTRPVHLRAVLRTSVCVAVAAGAVALASPTVASPTTGTSSPPPTPTLPVPSPTVEATLSVGGPLLARMGVVTDLPPGVPAPPTMDDVAWLVADMGTGNVIAAKAPHARLLPASTLKTLTAALLLPRVSLSSSFTATAADVAADGTRIGLVPGLAYTGEQLFDALLLGSANDAAYMLARINGGIPVTLAEENDLARRLGARDTVAGDPSGLDARGETSSAYDLALIARYAMENATFRRIVRTKSVWFPGNLVHPTSAPASGAAHPADPAGPAQPGSANPTITSASGLRATYWLGNHNSLLYNYPGTVGIKNGYTEHAHRTFISAVTRGGHTYIVTEMYGLDASRWRPTATLFDWAFAYGTRARPIGHLVVPGEALPTRTAPVPTPGTLAPVASPSATPPAATVPAENVVAGPLNGAAARSLASGAGLAAVLLGALALAAGRRRRARPRRH